MIVSLQPCDIPRRLVPEFPSNLANIYTEPNGFVPIAQSLTYDINGNPIIKSIQTDGNGHAFFYAQSNTLLTIAVYNTQGALQLLYEDQVL